MLEMYTSLALTILLFYVAYKGNHPKSKDTTPRDTRGRYIRRTVKRTARTIPVTINGRPEGSITL